MSTADYPVEREQGSAPQRVLLAVALALTVGAIAVGTWLLGSGDDPVEPERATTVVSDVSAPGQAQPPLPVAPPPASDAADTTG
jgi:hypothetical protein